MMATQTMLAELNRTSVLRLAWSWVRELSGDAAYENYLRCARRRGLQGDAGSPARLLSRGEFYLDTLQRRYSRASRCC
jgi:hypothetical protein